MFDGVLLNLEERALNRGRVCKKETRFGSFDVFSMAVSLTTQ